MENAELSLRIENSKPVELLDLTRSFTGVADQFNRFMQRQPDQPQAEDIRLYVREIKTGSIWATLVALAPLAVPAMEYANTVIGFGSYLRTAYGYFLGSGKKPDIPMERADLNNFYGIVEPIAKDQASQIVFSPIFNGNPQFNLNISCMESNAIQNAVRREMQLLREPETRLHEKVLLYWYQARNDLRSQTGDKAIVESIHRGPVKTVFATETVKAKILLQTENPFRHAYIVDLSVETIQGRPAAYKIIEMHEAVDLPEES